MTGEIVDVVERSGFQDVRMLDPYAGGIVEDEAPRIDAIATISAGYKDAPASEGKLPLPKASRDGTIYVHDATGRAPGLKAALETAGGKRLTLAFPFNNPNAFIQQRFTRYSATKLEVYGDELALFEITPQDHIRHEAGSPGYAKLVKTCKNAVSVYFTLGEWSEEGPRMVFPDGLGFYRLRFTSRHSLRNLRAAVAEVAAFTHGRIAGVPFDLALDYREVADPTGTKRTIPCWTFTMKPPQPLTSRTFAPVIRQALSEGAALMLPPPSPETLAYAALEGPEPDLDEPTDAEIERIERGGRCDARFWEAKFFATVDGTRWDSDEGRAAFMHEYSEGINASLAEFLNVATEADAHELITALESRIQDERQAAIEDRTSYGRLPGWASMRRPETRR